MKKKNKLKNKLINKLNWDYVLNVNFDKKNSYSKEIEFKKRNIFVFNIDLFKDKLNILINYLNNVNNLTNISYLYIDLKNVINTANYKRNDWIIKDWKTNNIANFSQNIDFTDKRNIFYINSLNTNMYKLKHPETVFIVNDLNNVEISRELKSLNLPILGFSPVAESQYNNDFLYSVSLGDSKALKANIISLLNNVFVKQLKKSLIKENQYVVNETDKTFLADIFTNRKKLSKIKLKRMNYIVNRRKNWILKKIGLKRKKSTPSEIIRDLVRGAMFIKFNSFLRFAPRYVWKKWKRRNKKMFEAKKKILNLKYIWPKRWLLQANSEINVIRNLRIKDYRSKLLYKRSYSKLKRKRNLSFLYKIRATRRVCKIKIYRNKKIRIYESRKFNKNQRFNTRKVYYNKNWWNKKKKKKRVNQIIVGNRKFFSKFNTFRLKKNSKRKALKIFKIFTINKKKRIKLFEQKLVWKDIKNKVFTKKTLRKYQNKKKYMKKIKFILNLKKVNSLIIKRNFSSFFKFEKIGLKKKILLKLKKHKYKFVHQLKKKKKKLNNKGLEFWLQAKARYEKQKRFYKWKKKNLKKGRNIKKKFSQFTKSRNRLNNKFNDKNKSKKKKKIVEKWSPTIMIRNTLAKKIVKDIKHRKKINMKLCLWKRKKTKLGAYKLKIRCYYQWRKRRKEKYKKFFNWKRNLYKKKNEKLRWTVKRIKRKLRYRKKNKK